MSNAEPKSAIVRSIGLKRDGGWVDVIDDDYVDGAARANPWIDYLEPMRCANCADARGWRHTESMIDSSNVFNAVVGENQPVAQIQPGSTAFCALIAKAAPDSQWFDRLRHLILKLSDCGIDRRLGQWITAALRSRAGSLNTPGPNREMLRAIMWSVTYMPSQTNIDALRRLTQHAVEKRTAQLMTGCAVLASIANEDALAALTLLAQQARRLTPRLRFQRLSLHVSKRLGITEESAAERFVPSFCLTQVGRHSERLGEITALLEATDGVGCKLRWMNVDGIARKSLPQSFKRQYRERLAELKTAAKNIESMMRVQRDRIESMFPKAARWRYVDWRECYLDHPLVGTIARRLIWEIDDGVVKRAATWLDGRLVDAAGEPVAVNEEGAIVSLWHPIGESIESVQAWRRFFEDRQIRQPFKQAHREVYLLTDAERNTGVYSNRFAAHILKQHQFNALCAARGWKNKLRLMVDDEYPPAFRLLASWGIRAEYWIEGAGSEYGADTNETGTYLYLTTDQVRFYRMDAQQVTAHAGGGGYHAGWRNEAPPEPLPLDQVPPLVFSEIMRDVDLFVGVASVGNDPAWGDSGVGEERQNYWRQYSFGDLSATAQTRKGVLERLVPRLKIAQRCSLSDKFLVVRGELRTYKIHLGSGNILMEPNDQYLCIVPKASAATSISTSGGGGGGGGVFLPFEGDRTMAIVLSKAFLLAADTKITDPTIVSQIGRAVT